MFFVIIFSKIKLQKYMLSRDFYNRSCIIVAKELLGCYLVHKEQFGKIVEVEAYLGQHDLACHAAKGLTKRTKVMFGPPGYAYVYLIYGIHHCFNVVTEAEGQGAAVLIRAIEPIINIEARTQGPGLLCKAMHIDKQLNGHDLLHKNLHILPNFNEPPFEIIERARIGVGYAKEWATKPLRFYIKDNPYVSKIE